MTTQTANTAPISAETASVLQALAGGDANLLDEIRRVLGQEPMPAAAALRRLIDAKLIDADALAAALARRYGLRVLSGDELRKHRVRAEGFSARFLSENWIVPLTGPKGEAVIAVLHPGDAQAPAMLRRALGGSAELAVLSMPDLEAMMRAVGYGGDPSTDGPAGPGDDEIAQLRDLASGSPVVMRVREIIQRAIDQRATDIHLEPMRDRLLLRFRIDGILRVVPPPPRGEAEAIVSRVKVLAGLDIAERRRPQDGGVRMALEGREIELRVATLPSIHGETLVVRILNRDGQLLELAGLGMSAHAQAKMELLLEHTHGMILAAGPTGSGKTTTLAGAVARLNDPGRKIVTIEDPVEYQIPGVIQTHIQPAIGLTFSTALRAFVRQDPDVILVGEVRDPETAKAAIQAALTGHLVLSTVHANTAAASLIRLRDLGVESYLLTAALRGIVAQRLVRRLCDACKRRAVVGPECRSDPRYAAVGLREGETVWSAPGCARCEDTGYRGRLAVFEILTMEGDIPALTQSGAGNIEIERAALEGGMVTMGQDAAEKARAGLTSAAEVVRVTGLR
jgi:general secretion pathway protein E